MKKPTTYLALIFIATMMPALCCCHDGGDEPAQGPSADKALAFAPSRAEDTTSNVYPLSDDYDSFDVWGSYCTTAGTDRTMVFGGGSITTYRVNYNTIWYYNAVGSQTFEYWDASARDYRFDAVAPVPENKDLVLSFSKDRGYTVRLNNITANTTQISDNERLAASTVRHISDDVSAGAGCCDEDLYKAGKYNSVGSLYSTVNMMFHHILSIVEFRIDPASQTASDFTSISATFDGSQIFTKASYNVTGLTWSDYSAPVSAMPAMTLPESKAVQVLEIPQEVKDKVLSLAVSTADGSVYTGQVTISKDWAGGKRYIYTLTINSDEKILVSVSVEDYKAYQSIDAEDELINW